MARKSDNYSWEAIQDAFRSWWASQPTDMYDNYGQAFGDFVGGILFRMTEDVLDGSPDIKEDFVNQVHDQVIQWLEFYPIKRTARLLAERKMWRNKKKVVQ
jgi:hypothetical protein